MLQLIGKAKLVFHVKCKDETPDMDPFDIYVLEFEDGEKQAFKEWSFDTPIEGTEFDVYTDEPAGYRIVKSGSEIESLFSYEKVDTGEGGEIDTSVLPPDAVMQRELFE